MNALGTHLLLDLKDCNPDILDDLHFIKQAMLDAAEEAGATVVGETFHKFHPIGVTGIIAIAESHIGIHTWPEYGFAAVDIFTCGEEFKPHKSASMIIEKLQCESPEVKEIRRGTLHQLNSAPAFTP